jgi:carbon-monoxide dehydrogenase large subunit
VKASISGTTRYSGSRVRRVEDARLLTGRGTFVDDVVRVGMAHACFVRSTVPRARIISIDAAEANRAPGVRAVLVAGDLDGQAHELWYSVDGGPGKLTPIPLLAQDEVRFVGDPVALVVADDRALAEDAAEQVVVELEPLNPIVDYRMAQLSSDLVHAGYDSNLAGRARGGKPTDVDAICENADAVVVHELYQQGYVAAPIEPRGILVEWNDAIGELVVWAATQAPHEVRSVLARVLDLPEHRIRVIMRDTGGGFGQKVVPMREELCIALAARILAVPLKWIETRRENLLAAGQARHEHGRARVALTADGTLLAASIDHVQDVGAYPIPWPVGPGAAVGMLFPGPYRIAATSYSHHSVFSNRPGRVAYRGPWMFESLIREVTLDLAARRVGIDPIELRRRNLLSASELPYTNGNGMPYSEMSPLETFEHAIDLLDLEAFRATQAAARAEGRHLGVGTSSYVEPTTPGYGYYATEGATIRIDPTGKVSVYVAGGSSGNSLETAVVQLTADALGVPIEDVTTVQGDTALTPYGAGTGGSRSGSMLAGAVEATARVLREKLVAIAAHQLEAAPEDIELASGQAFVRGSPDRGIALSELASIAYHQVLALPPGVTPGLEATERAATSLMPTWANATHVCVCEVDIETGGVEILRYIVSEDCGPMINPDIVEGQIAGGTVQGIGGALMEELAFAEDGTPLSTSFVDYLIPSMMEAPRIEFAHVVTPSAGPGGYKGVGEGGAIGAPAAVVNAVADALSPFDVEITHLPLTPERIVSLIHRTEDSHGGT